MPARKIKINGVNWMNKDKFIDEFYQEYRDKRITTREALGKFYDKLTDQYQSETINQIMNGTELMRIAIDDWNAFPDNDETLFDWYPDLAKVLPNKKYKVTPQLEFEEID